MLSDITNSIKAKLYDFTYTPFMSSVVISWIVLNHKYVLIYFGDAPLSKKLIMLNGYDFSCPLTNAAIPYAMNIWFPLIFGLFYVFIYPKFSKIFYEYTLERTKELKTIKKDIEDKTPVTQEEARKIREDIDRLSDAKDEALNKLRTKEAEYKEKLESSLQPLRKEVESLKSELGNATQATQTLTEERDNLQHKLTQAEGFLSSKNDDYAALQRKADETKSSVNDTIVPKEKEDERLSILKYLHDSYEKTYEKNLLDTITTTTGMARAKARNIVTSLIDEGILEKDVIEQVSITKEGGLKLVDQFE